MATPPAPPKSNTRRDALLKLEAQVQQQWETEGTFEADAQEGKPKFFVTFPHATVSHNKMKGRRGMTREKTGNGPRLSRAREYAERTCPGARVRPCPRLAFVNAV